jgi:hypothetical protein
VQRRNKSVLVRVIRVYEIKRTYRVRRRRPARSHRR